MKKIIIPLLILLWTIPCLARMNPYVGGVTVAATCADSSCTGFLVCQNFEGTGYDNSETWGTYNGSPDPDYTTSVLRGSQSLYLPEAAGVNAPTFTSTGELWIHLKLKVATRNTYNNLKKIIILNGNTDYYLALSDTGGLLIGDGSKYNYGTASTVTIGTVYHIWLYYKKGVSTTTMKAYISESTTIPETPDCQFADGTSNLDITDVRIIPSFGDGITLIVDQVLVKSGATAPSPVCN